MTYTNKLWVSHSSISDFLKCPRSYYLKNMYKDPKTGNKIQITSPALSLGTAVHEVLEELSSLKTDYRFETSLIERLDNVWDKIKGKKGGFLNTEEENIYRRRAEDMLNKIRKNPGPLAKPAVKIEMDLPQTYITDEQDIVLCGKIDWLEYIPESEGVNIIDFKTSLEAKEDPNSLQIPIYYILVKNCQKWNVVGASYWYLDQNDSPTPKELPDYEEVFNKVLSIARKIKLARQLENLKCPNGQDGCQYCKQYERILAGEGEQVHTDTQNKKDIYILKNSEEKREGKIL